MKYLSLISILFLATSVLSQTNKTIQNKWIKFECPENFKEEPNYELYIYEPVQLTHNECKVNIYFSDYKKGEYLTDNDWYLNKLQAQTFKGKNNDFRLYNQSSFRFYIYDGDYYSLIIDCEDCKDTSTIDNIVKSIDILWEKYETASFKNKKLNIRFEFPEIWAIQKTKKKEGYSMIALTPNGDPHITEGTDVIYIEIYNDLKQAEKKFKSYEADITEYKTKNITFKRIKQKYTRFDIFYTVQNDLAWIIWADQNYEGSELLYTPILDFLNSIKVFKK